MATINNESFMEIEKVLQEFTTYVETALKASLKAKGVFLTGATLDSLKSQVIAVAATQQLSTELSFQDSGILQQRKGYSYDKTPPIKAFEEFVSKKGLGSFQFIPGYEKSTALNAGAQERFVKRIAWAMVFARKKNGKQKARVWFNKTYYTALNNAVADIVEAHFKATGQYVSATLQQALQ